MDDVWTEHETVTTYVQMTAPLWWIHDNWEYLTLSQRAWLLEQKLIVPPPESKP